MLFWYFRTATFGPNVPSTTSIGSDVTAFDHAAGVRRASGFVQVGFTSSVSMRLFIGRGRLEHARNHFCHAANPLASENG
jgi:hypothetical protein